jgi:hypothetical protein
VKEPAKIGVRAPPSRWTSSGRVVLEREAVADEQHAHAAATAARELEIPARDGPEGAARETQLDQPGVHGDAEQDPGADDERRPAEAAHRSHRHPIRQAGAGT